MRPVGSTTEIPLGSQENTTSTTPLLEGPQTSSSKNSIIWILGLACIALLTYVLTQGPKEYLGELRLWEKRNDNSRSLSGGMKRRLMIARALIHQPKLLILDEPTAGVDIEIRRSMWKFLRSINNNGTTIILTTHYLEEAENLCRNVAIIDDGKIIQDTSMSSLLRQLKQETFILSVESELTAKPKLENFECNLLDSHNLEVIIDSNHGINELFELLNSQNIKINSMRNKSNRLEELFLKVVDNKKKHSN